MRYLVVGGSGYIGSHMVKHMLEAGYEVVVADLVSPGPGICWVRLAIADEAALDLLFGMYWFDVVFYYASLIQVGELVSAPGKYYLNNVAA